MSLSWIGPSTRLCRPADRTASGVRAASAMTSAVSASIGGGCAVQVGRDGVDRALADESAVCVPAPLVRVSARNGISR